MRRIPLSAGIAVLFLNASALAQQPLAFPMRSQSPWQTSVDTAMCYSYANQHTGVNMARQSQAPEKPKTTKPAAVHQVAVAAPLPSAMAPASAPVAASMVEASGTPKPGVAADARAAAHASSTSADAPMPALPPPEPPMVQYWRSYSECMTDRGYMVR
ncbi:hypothetical protein M0D69_38555 [Caballeronia sp. SEWSISQ10-4 2]|uniref:hypothetical protein n=1 Tax=Caballeronia sp. SEWSISQ10-4 2 TaxID=2937438 RepID=UPI00264E3B9F|nr:hypothetical protein [Caballeronia sp. SEWSISQ10-4 2]MDN7183817.1 hypothetical protein [Caballeronia sp. SEWSISQ10-4 2]